MQLRVSSIPKHDSIFSEIWCDITIIELIFQVQNLEAVEMSDALGRSWKCVYGMVQCRFMRNTSAEDGAKVLHTEGSLWSLVSCKCHEKNNGYVNKDDPQLHML